MGAVDDYLTTVDPAATGACARNGTCKTIQAAVDVSEANDTIRVMPGVYKENVALDIVRLRLTEMTGGLSNPG